MEIVRLHLRQERETIIGRWDLIIAHPPCTYLSNAGARWLYAGGVLNKERYRKGLEGKKLFMRIYNADCDKICIENPIPSKIYRLPEKSQIIEPYMFGHKATKKTCLWLKGLPDLQETNNVGRPEKVYVQKRDGTWRTDCWTISQRGKNGKNRQAIRSETFPGIANAMAHQWGGNMYNHKKVKHRPRTVNSLNIDKGIPCSDLELFFLLVQELLKEKKAAGEKGKKFSQDDKLSYKKAQGILFDLHSYFALKGCFSFGPCETCSRFGNAVSTTGIIGECKGQERHCFETCSEHSVEGGGFGL